MEEIIPALVVSVMGKFMQSAMNRSDFNYTHGKTNIPAQVREMHEAGLNPALAYGQISPAQGQALGNYQGDFAQNLKAMSESPLVKEQVESQKAQTEYYKSLAFKTRMEGLGVQFDVDHQQDRWNIFSERSALENIGLNLTNSGQFYKNIGQIKQNSILDLEQKMKNYDWLHYDETKKAELSHLTAETGLKIALTKSEDALRDWRVKEIQSNIRHLIDLRYLISQQAGFFKYQGLNAKYQSEMNKTEKLFMDYLTKNNKDFSTMDSRKRWSVYGGSIVSGINSCVTLGSLILTRGKGSVSLLPNGGINSPYKGNPRTSTPTDFPIYDHLGF